MRFEFEERVAGWLTRNPVALWLRRRTLRRQIAHKRDVLQDRLLGGPVRGMAQDDLRHLERALERTYR